MKSILICILILLSIGSCSESKQHCASTTQLQKCLQSFSKSNKIPKSDMTFTCIETFDSHFAMDTSKVAVRIEINFNQGILILEEYQFDPNFLANSAMDVTYVEFITSPRDEWNYYRVNHLKKGTCLIAKMKKTSESTEKAIDQMLREYEINNFDETKINAYWAKPENTYTKPVTKYEKK